MTETLKSHFLNLYAIALSDSQIDTVELEVLYNVGQNRGIRRSEIDEIILNPDKVRFAFPETLEEKISYLYDFSKMILADGVVDTNERKTLELFCVRFGFEEGNVPEIANFLIESANNKVSEEHLMRIIHQNIN